MLNPARIRSGGINSITGERKGHRQAIELKLRQNGNVLENGLNSDRADDPAHTTTKTESKHLHTQSPNTGSTINLNSDY